MFDWNSYIGGLVDRGLGRADEVANTVGITYTECFACHILENRKQGLTPKFAPAEPMFSMW